MSKMNQNQVQEGLLSIAKSVTQTGDLGELGNAVLITDTGVDGGIRRAINDIAGEYGFRTCTTEAPELPGQAFGDGFYEEHVAPADTVFYLPSRSRTHTSVTKRALEEGKRIISSTETTPELLACDALKVDVREMKKRFRNLERAIQENGGIEGFRVTSDRGTDFYAEVADRIYADDGTKRFCNIPFGEAAYCAKNSEGILVADGTVASMNGEPVILEVRDGRISDIRGGARAGRLAQILDKRQSEYRAKNPEGAGDAYFVGEFGIGMNDKASPYEPTSVRAEKAIGTVHCGFGDNRMFGGDNAIPYHDDAVVAKPTLTAHYRNGKSAKLIDEGRCLLGGDGR